MKNFYRFKNIFGIGFLSSHNLNQLRKIESNVFELFSDMAVKNGANMKNIKSQICQDIFVLFSLNWKKRGFFIEFGATNGVDLSNTYLLEKDFGWNGILVEPANVWHKDLKANRSASIDFDCVWSKSGEVLDFTLKPNFEFSKISNIKKNIFEASISRSKSFMVKTISLLDLLQKYSAPLKIDYLSIDTEGSEFEILSAFNFDKYAISVITCEHNFSSDRIKIYNLLSGEGFIRVFDGFSRWDDWYIHPENISNNH